jgi:DOPA 4,5-dioxygenase
MAMTTVRIGVGRRDLVTSGARPPALVPVSRSRDTSANQMENPSMTNPSTGSPEVQGYHAHVYYGPDSLPAAEKLHDTLAANFPVEVGQLRDDPIGPHPVSQFAVIIKPEYFQTVVPWLMFNREGLDILVHPLTDDQVDDHSIYALWLGTPIELKLDVLPRRGYRATLLPTAA